MNVSIHGDLMASQLRLLSRAALRSIKLGHFSGNRGTCAKDGQAFAEHLIRLNGNGFPDEKTKEQNRERAEFCYDWVCHGMPKVVVEPKLAASLMATRIPREFCDHVESPWKVFVIIVPAGVLSGVSHTLYVRSVKVALQVDPKNPTRHPMAGVRGADFHPYSLAPRAPGLRVLGWCEMPSDPTKGAPILQCAPWVEFADPDVDHEENVVDEMKRFHELLSRFVFGAVAELQGDKSHQRAIAGTPLRPRDKRGEPICWTVHVSRPVVHDVSSAVREYVRGSGRSLRLQGIVRGHWKNQPCGSGGAERKFMHIEPYWRGPEDAPIAVRSHVLKGPGESVAAE